MASSSRDHIAVLLYAIEEGHDPVPPHVIQLAMAAIGAAGFDPAARVVLDEEAAAGDESQQQRAGNAVAASEFNYLRYVRAREHWPPASTTRSSHLRDLRDAALDPAAGLALCNAGTEQAVLVVVQPPPAADSSRGWTLVVLDPASRHWVEGFRTQDVGSSLSEHGWHDVRWLREARTA
jgi:hypothetical protein